MGDKKHSKTEEQDTFSYDDTPDEKKYQRRFYITLGSGALTIISLIVLGSIFFTDRTTFSKIFAFYSIYLWVLPLLCVMMRSFYFLKRVKKEQKKGRIFMTFGFYFLFLWIASLATLLMLLGGANIAWMADAIFWVSTCVFIPYLLFVLIAKF